MQTLLQDLRYAARMLLRQPVFTIIAVLTLALGIGANTAIFSIIDAALLHSLPYPDSDHLVRLWAHAPQRLRKGSAELDQAPVGLSLYETIRDGQTSFEGLSAFTWAGFTLTGRGDPAQTNAAHVSGPFFQTLGVKMAHGRDFLPSEDQPGGPKVVILSHPFWQKHFGGDPSLVGRTITLDDTPYTVVGILSDKLAQPLSRVEVWVPRVVDLSSIPAAMVRQGSGFLVLTARLKPGVTMANAQAEVNVLHARYAQAFPGHVDTTGEVRVIPYQEEIVGQARPTFYTLAAAVGCVLLIACVNVANLLLARLAGRRKEIAVRAALGASRGRLLRQFLTESLLLALLAGALGTLLAVWSVDFVRTIDRHTLPRADEVHISVGTLLFTLAVSAGTGLLLGVVPALRAAGGNAGEALQQAGTRGAVGGGARQGRAQAAMLVAQVALSLVLLAATGLLITSLWKLQKTPVGFDPPGVLTTGLNLPPARYGQAAQQADFTERLIERLNAIPGVKSSAAGTGLPLEGSNGFMFYAVIGQPIPPVDKRSATRYDCVTPGYFPTLGVAIKEGRNFDARDRADSPPVVIISDTMARNLFPGESAVGKKLLCTVANPTETEIVGVTADVRSVNLAEAAPEEMFFAWRQRPQPYMNVIVRAENPAQALGLATVVSAAVHELDRDEPVGEYETMDTVVARSTANRRLMSSLLAAFAGLALVLAAIGIYGVAAYGVAQRTREIGIRMALGADKGDVFRLVIGGGMKLVAAGVVLGLLVAFGLTRLLSSLLYGVGASDPVTFGGVIVVLGAVAFLANYLPARRATRIDPMAALREE